LSPSRGHLVTGTAINEHEFEGRVKAAQLFTFAEDPRKTESEGEYRGNTNLEAMRHLRLQVQRLFQGEKRKNVESYSQYIVGLHRGEDGLTPTIVLWSPNVLEYEEVENGDGMARLLIPFTERLIAIDGETQLAARYVARDIDQDTAETWVAIKVCHGRNVDCAKQVFHDLNVLGVQPNAALAIGMDNRDPLTAVARDVEANVPLFKGRVNRQSRQLKARDREIMTISTLRGACITLAEGISGIKHGSNPVSIRNKEKVDHIRTVALEWFSAVAEKIGPAIEDRQRTVASAPAVMAAIGALGHELVEISNPVARQRRTTELAEKIALVNWEKGQHWEGIAGKFTPKDKFSLGGPKETAYAIYAAIGDVTTEAYRRVRDRKAAMQPA
jgi:DNA sulfur modification protein DndB